MGGMAMQLTWHGLSLQLPYSAQLRGFCPDINIQDERYIPLQLQDDSNNIIMSLHKSNSILHWTSGSYRTDVPMWQLWPTPASSLMLSESIRGPSVEMALHVPRVNHPTQLKWNWLDVEKGSSHVMMANASGWRKGATNCLIVETNLMKLAVNISS